MTVCLWRKSRPHLPEEQEEQAQTETEQPRAWSQVFGQHRAQHQHQKTMTYHLGKNDCRNACCRFNFFRINQGGIRHVVTQCAGFIYSRLPLTYFCSYSHPPVHPGHNKNKKKRKRKKNKKKKKKEKERKTKTTKQEKKKEGKKEKRAQRVWVGTPRDGPKNVFL